LRIAICLRLHREEIAHGMGEDRDLLDVAISDHRLQHGLERVARIGRALAVVGVVDELAARGPGEEHGHDGRAGVMHDLRETIDRLFVTRVVAVHEQKDVPRGPSAQTPVEGGDGRLEVEPVGAQGDEIMRGIAGDPGRPLHLANLTHGVGRDGDRHIGEAQADPPLAVEHDRRRHTFVRAGGRHQHVDGARPGRARRDRDEIAARPARACAEAEDDDQRHG
jgi:hypothetical protein